MVDEARSAVRPVAFARDALIPVMEGSSGVLNLNRLQPGILPRRLIKMAVDTNIAGKGRGHAAFSKLRKDLCPP
jgi:hypothetical protein